MVDSRLLTHWEKERGEREQLRRSLPPSWRDDPRPKMAEVREQWVEGMLEIRRASAGQPIREQSRGAYRSRTGVPGFAVSA